MNNTLKYANPIVNLNSSKLLTNIKELNNELPSSLKGNVDIGDYLNIDIKMETGTGKTYVYTKTIFELNKNYGIHKFIILVPSLPIKLGTTNFINSYKEGKTPNPCVVCNKKFKFGLFYKKAKELLNADYIATGHYASLKDN